MSQSTETTVPQDVAVLAQRIVDKADKIAKSRCEGTTTTIIVPIPGNHPNMEFHDLELRLKEIAGIEPDAEITFNALDLEKAWFTCKK